MNKPRMIYVLALFIPLPVLLVAVLVGASSDVSMGEYLKIMGYLLWGNNVEGGEERLTIARSILVNIRLPRVLLAFLSGASLSVSGTILQAIFRNPLVDAYMLGIASGAAFGVSLAIMLAFSIYPFAFFFGLVAVGITYLIAFSKTRFSMVAVVLSGMVVAGLFTALLSAVQLFINPYKLQAIVQWTLGNLNTASWAELQRSYLPIVLSLGVVCLLRWRLNILAMGGEMAKSVGVNPMRDTLILVLCASVLTAVTVASIGVVAMFGLLVPHMVRMIFGADNRVLVPMAICLGGSFFVVIDIFSRSLFEFEIPIGIFTVVLGAPFFIYLMRKKQLNWQ